MSAEYKPGACVVYDTYGICKIIRTEKISFSKQIPKQDYYVLSPLNSPASTYYVPVFGEAAKEKLRLPMTEQQIKSILSKAEDKELEWIDKRQERNDCFSHILSSGISPELIRLIRCLFEKRKDLSNKGKKLSSTDEGVFSAAEKLVREEFAFSLGISPDTVSEYIHNFFQKQN